MSKPAHDPAKPVDESAVKDWQRWLFDQISAERAANEELLRTDPEAYKAKILTRFSVCA